MKILGIDPGITGAFAIYDTRAPGTIEVYDMPVLEIVRNGKKKRSPSPHLITDLLSLKSIDRAFLEEVSARPGESPVASFAFGRGVGQIEGILAYAGIPTTGVRPNTWTKVMKMASGKDASRQKAMELWPDHASLFRRVMDNGRADAALIAYYGYLEATK